jgi:uncharacterized DUF497 family protein
MSAVRFEWDPEKAANNERIHGVSFEEATELFRTDAPVLEMYAFTARDQVARHVKPTVCRRNRIHSARRGIPKVRIAEKAPQFVAEFGCERARERVP